MEKHELTRRLEDLAARCEKSGAVTGSHFLTPAEQYQAERDFQNKGARLMFHGGHPDCERKAAFFLPDWMEPEDFDPSEHLRAIRLTAHFGAPGHRDYLGALLGMGIGREWLGDIWVEDGGATVFCLPSVEKHLLGIDKAGRVSLTAEPMPLNDLRAPERKTEERSFTVMSPRLDAVLAGMFRLSRSEAARQISLGMVSVNYALSNKTDYYVQEGDILSLRGSGKGRVLGFGGNSRKGRLYVYTEIYQ
ncbi:MAG: RNA-binding protein [Clostridia bacterium]